MARTRKAKKRKQKIYWLSAKQVQETARKNWGKIFCSLVVIGLIVFMAISLNSFLFASDYFNLSEIEVIDQDPEKIDYPLARIDDQANIFRIDLEQIASNVEQEYYDIQKAIVKRVLPNKLVIEVLRRRPIGQIEVAENQQAGKADHFFLVNKDAYVLADIGSKKRKALPVIVGAELTAQEIEVGRAYPKPNLLCALEFLEELNNSGFLDKYNVTLVDVTQPRIMSFYVDDLEVKIGNRNLRQKIENLGGILASKDIDYSQGYYIDLRFKDIVFGRNE
ncbi:MAG: FtsQ-type POTRA domain-containing protein [Candidatus Omnitrophica bacterium]|nr:FtsQ-type POTRA domain-containing protein [Candidatus Omnitrophota bacterium]